MLQAEPTLKGGVPVIWLSGARFLGFLAPAICWLGLVYSPRSHALNCPDSFTVTYSNFVKQPLSHNILNAARRNDPHIIVAWARLSEMKKKSFSFVFDKKLASGSCVYRVKGAERQAINEMVEQSRIYYNSGNMKLKTWFQESIDIVGGHDAHKLYLNYQITNRLEQTSAEGIKLNGKPGIVSVRYNHGGSSHIHAGSEINIGLNRYAFSNPGFSNEIKMGICEAVYVDYYEYGEVVDEYTCFKKSQFTLVKEKNHYIEVDFEGVLSGIHRCRLRIDKPINEYHPSIISCRFEEQ